MKRVTWFVGGVAAGAAGAGFAARKVRETAEQLKPVNLAKSVGRGVKGGVGNVVDAIREGRDAMHEREDSLRARRDGSISPLDERLVDGEQIYVDGHLVDTDRVVVLSAPSPPSSPRTRTGGRHRRRS